MTKNEAAAVAIVLSWVFEKPKERWDPARFKQACLLLADGVEKKGGSWSRARVEAQRWS